MFNSWDLHVTNFGRIKEAKITVSPFMMFVGKNNSGKSYMMQLLWGIVEEVPRITERIRLTNNELDNAMRKMKQELIENDRTEVNEDVQNKLLEILNFILNEDKERILQRIFNFDVSIDYLALHKKASSKVYIERINPELRFREEFLKLNYEEETLTLGGEALGREEGIESIELLLRFVMCFMITKGISKTMPFTIGQIESPIYFPASRSGFMQTYRAIVGNVFEASFVSSFSDKDKASSIAGTQLTLPVTRFISELQKHNFSSEKREKYVEEINFLNTKLLGGEIDKDESQQFRFRSSGDQQAYPLHVTSSLISELAPISIFLSAQSDPNLWIIEEVESHLHSEMQLRMARFLFRMLNKGKSIWITTHSDNLAQQINNLLTISQHPHQQALLERLGYEKADILNDLSMVNAYQFEGDGDFTTVNKLTLESYGFVIDTFNDTLRKLIDETDLIQNYAE